MINVVSKQLELQVTILNTNNLVISYQVFLWKMNNFYKWIDFNGMSTHLGYFMSRD